MFLLHNFQTFAEAPGPAVGRSKKSHGDDDEGEEEENDDGAGGRRTRHRSEPKAAAGRGVFPSGHKPQSGGPQIPGRVRPSGIWFGLREKVFRNGRNPQKNSQTCSDQWKPISSRHKPLLKFLAYIIGFTRSDRFRV